MDLDGKENCSLFFSPSGDIQNGDLNGDYGKEINIQPSRLTSHSLPLSKRRNSFRYLYDVMLNLLKSNQDTAEKVFNPLNTELNPICQ